MYISKNSLKNVAWKLIPGFKESSVKRNLRRSVYWFGQILIVLLMHVKYKFVLQNLFFPIWVILNSLQTQKSLELVFRSHIL